MLPSKILPLKTPYPAIAVQLLVFGLLSSFVRAQNNYSVVQYGIETNKAELSIAAGNFGEALSRYDSLFESRTTVFAKDLYNAVLTASVLHDEQKALKFALALRKRNFDLDSLLSNPVIKKNFSAASVSRLQATAPEYCSDSSLRKQLMTLFHRDQNPRQEYDYKNRNRQNVYSADSLNVKELNALVAANGGLPGECQTGVYSPDLLWQPYYFVILHQTPVNKIFDYASLVLEEIKKGNIEPHTGAHLYTITSGNTLENSAGSAGQSCCYQQHPDRVWS